MTTTMSRRPAPPRPSRATYIRRRLTVATAAIGVVVALFAFSWWVSHPTGLTTDARADPTAVPATTVPTPSSTPPTTLPVAPTPAPTAPTADPALTVAPLGRGAGPVPVVHKVTTDDPVVFLTVDDGVVKDPALVEFLRSRNVPITMFLTSSYIGDGSHFQQLASAGASAQSHTVTHAKLAGADATTQQREVCGPTPEYAQLFGSAPRYFRPPYGVYDPTTLSTAASCGMKAVVHWNAEMAGTVFSRVNGGFLRAGDIVLLHFKDDLITNLQLLLDQMTALGLRPAQLTDYLDAAPVA